MPFSFDETLRLQSDITPFGLLNPFALLVGLVSLSMIVLHGAAWLNYKTLGPVQVRARAAMPLLAVVFAMLFVLAGFWLSLKSGFRIEGTMAHDGPSNPLLKQVGRSPWALAWVAPAVALAGAALAVALRGRPLAALLCTALTTAATIATAGLTLFPFLLPSSAMPGASLTVWDASSSKLTLAVMLGVTCLLLPVVIAYTAWVYRVLRGPVSENSIKTGSHSY